MLIGLVLDIDDLADIRRAIDQLCKWEAALDGVDAQQAALREVLSLDTARLVRLAYEHFGTGPFTLAQLAQRANQKVRVLHGMTGSLGRACESRSVEVFDRHGGQPLSLSVRQEVADILAADILAAEAGAPATE